MVTRAATSPSNCLSCRCFARASARSFCIAIRCPLASASALVFEGTERAGWSGAGLVLRLAGAGNKITCKVRKA